MRNLITHSVEVWNLDSVLCALPGQGRLAETPEGLVYLNIDDRYIHDVFALLHQQGIEKPPYFDIRNGGVGAHISIFYPEEENNLHPEDWGKIHNFKIEKLAAAQINDTKYFVLLVNAPSLVTLRLKYGYPKKLAFKGHSIDFHITVGVQMLF